MYPEYEDLLQFNSGKINNPVFKMGEMKSLFPKEEIQMNEKLMKRCSTLLTIGEMQVKTTVRCTEKDLEHLEFHTTLVRIKNTQSF